MLDLFLAEVWNGYQAAGMRFLVGFFASLSALIVLVVVICYITFNDIVQWNRTRRHHRRNGYYLR